MKTLTEMIACAKRELAIRERVYPKWVESKRMTADQCRHEIETMQAIVAGTGKPKPKNLTCFNHDPEPHIPPPD